MASHEDLARRNSAVQWSGIRVMFSLADEIPDVINLGIGQPDFDTPSFIREAAKRALDDGYTRYPPARGFRDLREAIAEKLKEQNHIAANPDSEIFVSVGAMQGVINTILHLVDPGDEVIVIDPGYDYYSQIGLFGGIPVRVPAYEGNRFKVDPDDIRKAITNKTKLLIVNTPSNPTGAVLDEAIVREVCQVVLQHGIFVLSDEPYESIVFELPGVDNVAVWSLKPKPIRSIFFLGGGGFDAFVSSFKPSHIELLGCYLTSQRTQI